MRGPRRCLQHAVQVFDLEDGIGQDLGRAVVDLLGQTLALALLGVDHPQPHGRRRLLGVIDGRLANLRVGAEQVPVEQLQVMGSRLEALQPVLLQRDLARSATGTNHQVRAFI